MISISKVAFTNCGEYPNQAAVLKLSLHPAFSSEVHYSVTDSKQPVLQPCSRVRPGVQGRSRIGWWEPQKRGHREKVSGPKVTSVHPHQECTWQDTCVAWSFDSQYPIHPSCYFLLWSIISLCSTLSHSFFFLISSFPLGCTSLYSSLSVICAPGSPHLASPSSEMSTPVCNSSNQGTPYIVL